MSTTDLPSSLRALMPDELDAPFWIGCTQGRFLLQQCATCSRFYWPASSCVDHGRSHMSWVDSSGRGSVHAFTIVHRQLDPERRFQIPFSFAVVTLDEGPYFHSQIRGIDPDEIREGMPVTARMELLFDDVVAPVFYPDSAL